MTRAASPPRSRVPIGAHCNGGLAGAVKKALAIGARPFQIFIGSPQTWRQPEPDDAVVARFREEVAAHRLGPVFVHGTYLVNLAAENGDFLRKSVAALAWQLRQAERAGAAGVIFHPGSAGRAPWPDARRKTVGSIRRVLDGYDGRCRLLLEMCAGQGNTIGCTFEQYADLLEDLGHDARLGIAWDTAHLFAAGYDIASARGLRETLARFDELIGFDRLHAVHANDSKVPLGARRDRHENIGRGCIGEAAFRRMLKQAPLRRVPWILEVPGMAGKGPDRENIDLLHRLARR